MAEAAIWRAGSDGRRWRTAHKCAVSNSDRKQTAVPEPRSLACTAAVGSPGFFESTDGRRSRRVRSKRDAIPDGTWTVDQGACVRSASLPAPNAPNVPRTEPNGPDSARPPRRLGRPLNRNAAGRRARLVYGRRDGVSATVGADSPARSSTDPLSRPDKDLSPILARGRGIVCYRCRFRSVSRRRGRTVFGTNRSSRDRDDTLSYRKPDFRYCILNRKKIDTYHRHFSNLFETFKSVRDFYEKHKNVWFVFCI